MSGMVGRLLESVVDWLAGDGRIYYFQLGGRDFCCPLGVVITWHGTTVLTHSPTSMSDKSSRGHIWPYGHIEPEQGLRVCAQSPRKRECVCNRCVLV